MKTLLLFIFILINLASARTPEERKTLFSSSVTSLKKSGIESKIPKVGDTFPDIILTGKNVSTRLKDGPLVITFYRGGWCPYCVKQLKDLEQALAKIQEARASLIAISPEQPKEVHKTRSKNNLTFTLISDPGNTISRRLNLVFRVDDEVSREYQALGVDLSESQGNKNQELPIPATFVITRDRKIIYAFADADYTKRASIEDIMNALSAGNR